ncbi:MAG: response regulator transcription factor [Eubacterium sp.]
MINVLVVDDQRIAREYMERIVNDAQDYNLVGSISDADFAVLVCQRQAVDLILMDVCTKGDRDGIDVASQLKKEHKGLKIIIVTSMVEESFLKRAHEANVDSFWYKDSSPEALIEVMDRTVAGEHLFPGETPLVEFVTGTSEELTEAQIKVLRLVCEGLEYREIAEKLHCSVNNVKYHITQILQITGYSSKTQLAVAVTNKRFIIPELPESNKLPVIN